MMDEEVIFAGNDLSKHLLEQGYSDFESYILNRNVDVHSYPSNNYGINVNYPKTNEYLLPLSAEDRNILEKILSSKLLFTEDASHIEVLLYFTCCDNSLKNTLYNYVCAAVAAGFPLIMLKKWFNKSWCVPISITTFYLLNFAFERLKTADERFLDLYIKNLQNICSTVHKALRFIKETEIITTGQVSMHNVCAAIYMKPRNLSTDELNELPSWKTLPQTRKCLAEALVDLIRLFSMMFKTSQQNTPLWAKDYIISSEFHNLEFCNKLNISEHCFSIKDLQMLFDTYLVIQSEFLKLIAFSFFPIKSQSYNLNRKFRYHTLNLLTESESKLLYIYSQLKMLYNMECIFQKREHNFKPLSNCKLKEINTLQLKLHRIYVMLSSLALKSKGFEDHVEDITNFNKNPNVDDITTTVINQMSNLKEDLAYLIKSYDEIYNEIDFKLNKKCNDSVDKTLEPPNKDDNVRQLAEKELHVLHKKECLLTYNSTDEIFIGVSDQKTHENESYHDDWSPQIKPAVPKSMLIELSSTLIPIKEEFKRREKLALERKGLQDIESSNESGKKCSEEQNIDRKYKCVNNICSPSPEPVDITSNNKSEEYSQIVSSSSLANLAAKKSHLWNQLSEEHFSDG